MKSDYLDGSIAGLEHGAVLRIPVVACLISRYGFEGRMLAGICTTCARAVLRGRRGLS